MPSPARELELLDAMWDRIQPLLPPQPDQPLGGRPFADDKRCLAGIVSILRNGGRWNDMPREFPSGVTCWRRHRDWTARGVWPKVWKAILRELEAAGKLDTSELAIDATFAEAQKGGTATAARSAVTA
jgi:transposase